MIDYLTNHTDEANALIALCAVVISVFSLFVTIYTTHLQRKHNYHSLAPLVWIQLGDYEEDILVKIENTGVGPIVFKKLSVTKGEAQKGSVVEWMPTDITWKGFVNIFSGRSIPAGGHLTILHLTGDASDEDFIKTREEVRSLLSELTVNIEFEDIYKRKQPTFSRSLDWFGRTKQA
jgi:hypothetical protein